MRGDDDHAAGVRDLAQQPQDAVDLYVVEMRRRLVRQQQRRVERQRPGDGDALLLTARQLPGRCDCRSARPTWPSSSAARRRAARAPRPSARSGTWTFSAAVRLGIRLKAWKTMPTLRRR